MLWLANLGLGGSPVAAPTFNPAWARGSNIVITPEVPSDTTPATPDPTPGPVGDWSQYTTNSYQDIRVTRAEHDSIVAANPGSQEFWGVSGSDMVIEAWCGAAFDETGKKVYYTGGGHADYGGNEVVQVDLVTRLWSRLREPSPLYGDGSAGCDGRKPTDGSPPAVHTYSGLQWHPLTSTVFSFEKGTGFAPSGCPQLTLTDVWEFDPATQTWTAHPAGSQSYPTSCWASDYQEIWCLGYNYPGVGYIVDSAGTASEVALAGSQSQFTSGAMVYDSANQCAWYCTRQLRYKITKGANLTVTYLGQHPVQVQNIFQTNPAGALRNGKIWLWWGAKDIVTWDPITDEYRHIQPATPPGQPISFSTSPQNKLHYWAEQDAFLAVGRAAYMWRYQPTTSPTEGTLIDPNATVATIGSTGYTTIQAAADAVQPGQTVTIVPGTYTEATVWTADNVTIQATGVHIKDTSIEGKAAIVMRGSQNTIIGLEGSGVTVPDGNGAIVRLEGAGLTLRNINWHDSEQGILVSNGVGGALVIEDSTMERIGNLSVSGDLAHPIYNSSELCPLIIRRSSILSAKAGAHEVKTRGPRCEIYDSTLDSQDSVDSRNIDMPHGGVLIVDNCTITKGPNSEQQAMIGYGRGVPTLTAQTTNSITITNTAVSNSRAAGAIFLEVDNDVPNLTIVDITTGNTFTGVSGGATYV